MLPHSLRFQLVGSNLSLLERSGTALRTFSRFIEQTEMVAYPTRITLVGDSEDPVSYLLHGFYSYRNASTGLSRDALQDGYNAKIILTINPKPKAPIRTVGVITGVIVIPPATAA